MAEQMGFPKDGFKEAPMSTTLNGVVHGKRIDLEAEVPVPDGAPVIVRLEPRRPTAEERRRIMAATAGSWADDPSLEAVFADIARRRREAVPRQSTVE
jgi:hypothetical protein